MLITVAAFIVILGVLIFVHELGHFLTAKLVDIEVPRFSIGFGPRLIGFKKGETEYVISLLPLGGYVKMAGMEEMEVIEGKERHTEPAGVVDVGVAEHDRVDALGVEREAGVLLVGLGALALEEAAVEEDALAGGLEEVHRAGDFAGGAPEGDAHQPSRWKTARSRRGERGTSWKRAQPARRRSFSSSVSVSSS